MKSLGNQKQFHPVELSNCIFFGFFVHFPDKMRGNKSKILRNAYVWGYAMCYKALHMGV